jgi:hypothetical protein
MHAFRGRWGGAPPIQLAGRPRLRNARALPATAYAAQKVNQKSEHSLALLFDSRGHQEPDGAPADCYRGERRQQITVRPTARMRHLVAFINMWVPGHYQFSKLCGENAPDVSESLRRAATPNLERRRRHKSRTGTLPFKPRTRAQNLMLAALLADRPSPMRRRDRGKLTGCRRDDKIIYFRSRSLGWVRRPLPF